MSHDIIVKRQQQVAITLPMTNPDTGFLPTIGFVGSEKSHGLIAAGDSLKCPVPTNAQKNQIMFAMVGGGSSLGVSPLESGWTEVYSVGLSGPAQQGLFTGLWYRFIIEANPSEYGFVNDAASSARDMTVTFSVFSEVDLTTPLDIPFDPNLHFERLLDNSTPSNKPITSITNGAAIVIWYAITRNHQGMQTIAPDSYLLIAETADLSEDSDLPISVAAKTKVIAGTETPTMWNSTGTDQTEESHTFTFSLRPRSLL